MCARLTIGIKKYDENSNNWMDPSITKLIEYTKRLRKCLQKLKNKNKQHTELQSKYKQANKVKTKLVRKKKKEANEKTGKLISNSTKDTKIFWFEANKIRNNKFEASKPLKRDNSTYTADESEKCEIFHKFFTDKPKENEYTIEFHFISRTKFKLKMLEYKSNKLPAMNTSKLLLQTNTL